MHNYGRKDETYTNACKNLAGGTERGGNTEPCTSAQNGYNKYFLEGVTTGPDGKTVYKQISESGSPSKPNLNAGSGVSGDRSYYFQSYLDYNRSFNDHNVSAMLLYNMSEYNNNVIGNNNLIGSLPKRKIGFAGRVTYDYAHR